MSSKNRIDVSTPTGLLSAFEHEERSMRSVRSVTYDISKKHSLYDELHHILMHVQAQIKRIRHERPDEATEWRAVQCYVEALKLETAMWIAISKNNASGAWDLFCEAEREALSAVQHLRGHAVAERQLAHIRDVERVVFSAAAALSQFVIYYQAAGHQVQRLLQRVRGVRPFGGGDLWWYSSNEADRSRRSARSVTRRRPFE